MCTFLMKMREYYRWENELPYSCNLPREEVGDWLVQREKDWAGLESVDFSPLPLDKIIDPFEMDKVNEQLVPLGYIYSAGYGIFNKPLFFLGQLDKRETHDGATLLLSSCEYARDLVAPPAMSRDNIIFIRGESVKRFVWERLEEWRWGKQTDGPLPRAIAELGDDTDPDCQLDSLSALQIDIMLHHELGEILLSRHLGSKWEHLLHKIAGTKGEFLMRALRDNLADCVRTLPYLLSLKDITSLHLYFANFTGLRKHLFPELHDAYKAWHGGQSIERLDHAIRKGEAQFCQQAEQLLNLESGDTACLENEITSLVQPVTGS